MIKKEFHTGELFGIKAYDYSVRTGVKVACAGAWLPEANGFRINMISTEGVTGSQQCVRFERREDAERYIREHHDDLGYNESDMGVVVSRGTNMFIPAPVANFDVVGWTNARKWDYLSDRAKQRLIAARPDLYDGDDRELAPEESIQNTNTFRYRGFRF